MKDNLKTLERISAIEDIAPLTSVETAALVMPTIAADAAVAALTPLADPGTATNTEIGTLLNAVIAALQ